MQRGVSLSSPMTSTHRWHQSTQELVRPHRAEVQRTLLAKEQARSANFLIQVGLSQQSKSLCGQPVLGRSHTSQESRSTQQPPVVPHEGATNILVPGQRFKEPAVPLGSSPNVTRRSLGREKVARNSCFRSNLERVANSAANSPCEPRGGSSHSSICAFQSDSDRAAWWRLARLRTSEMSFKHSCDVSGAT